MTELRFTPTELGQYTLRCAELCGVTHAYMLATVEVLEPADFQSWVSGTGEQTLEEIGQRVYGTYCDSCHSVDGTPLVGPTFSALYQSQRPLQSGETVTADDEYLRTSILNPGSQVVQGFSNIMPGDYGERLTPQEIDALVAYIQSLGQ